MLNSHVSGSMQMKCMQCGVSNELTAVCLPSNEAVECSHCHAVLGNWETLVAGVAETAEKQPMTGAPA